MSRQTFLIDPCGERVAPQQIVMFLFQELLAIQQQGPKSIGFFGTRNMGFMHQELIEILSYALVITVRSFLSVVFVSFNTQNI